MIRFSTWLFILSVTQIILRLAGRFWLFGLDIHIFHIVKQSHWCTCVCRILHSLRVDVNTPAAWMSLTELLLSDVCAADRWSWKTLMLSDQMYREVTLESRTERRPEWPDCDADSWSLSDRLIVHRRSFCSELLVVGDGAHWWCSNSWLYTTAHDALCKKGVFPTQSRILFPASWLAC